MTAQRATQLIEAGVWLQATGDHEGARRLFEQALQLDPTNARARQFLDRKAPSASPAPVAPRPAPEPYEPLPPPISTGTVSYGASRNPFARQPLLDALADLEFGAPAPAPAPASSASSPTMIFGTVPPESPKPSAAGAGSAWDAGGARSLEIATSGPRANDALSLVTEAHTPLPFRPSSPSQEALNREEVRTLLRGAEDLIGLDDHSGALDLLQKALELEPGNADAEKMRQKAERTLLAMYESKLGPLDGAPRVALKQDEIIWLNLDHRAGFVLAQIDGQVTYDDLFSICGMTRLDTARILAQLKDEGVIATKK